MKYLIIISLLLSSMISKGQAIDDYFKIAAEHNPGLQAVYKEYEAALQKVPQVNTLPDPTFSFGYFISPVETRLGPQRARFSLTQMFPWFGTLKAQGDAAALMAEAKFQSFLDARNKLYFQVATAYYPLYELNSLISIEQENAAILESYKSISTKKFENGIGTMVDVLRVDIMLNEAETNLIVLKEKEKPLLTAFNKLLNRPENDQVVLSDSLISAIPVDDFRKDSLLSNPVLNALDLKIKAGKASEEASQKQGLPKLGVGVDYVIVGERTDVTMPDNGKDVLMPMLTLTIPVFRNKYNASVKEARLMQESYSFQKAEMANTLLANYEMAWFETLQQNQQILLYEHQIKTSQQSLNLLISSYGNSGRDFEEVLRMQQQLLKYQKMRATALSQYQISLAKINYLTAKSY